MQFPWVWEYLGLLLKSDLNKFNAEIMKKTLNNKEEAVYRLRRELYATDGVHDYWAKILSTEAEDYQPGDFSFVNGTNYRYLNDIYRAIEKLQLWGAIEENPSEFRSSYSIAHSPIASQIEKELKYDGRCHYKMVIAMQNYMVDIQQKGWNAVVSEVLESRKNTARYMVGTIAKMEILYATAVQKAHSSAA
ncbi:MAG: hypothetical protein KDK71_05665 [Chlamydiia bacterium]|nr:hypothetical protein [Chlamydiia bacterium]